LPLSCGDRGPIWYLEDGYRRCKERWIEFIKGKRGRRKRFPDPNEDAHALRHNLALGSERRCDTIQRKCSEFAEETLTEDERRANRRVNEKEKYPNYPFRNKGL
jgi:hypothetical protein